MPGGAAPSRRPLVAAGIPRSGTTWTMQALECDSSLFRVKEPDHGAEQAPAIWAKRQAGRIPVLAPGDRDDSYHRLWEWILDGASENVRLRIAAQMLRVMSPPAWGKANRVRAIPTLERSRYQRGGFSLPMTLAGAIASHPPVRRNPALDDHRLLVKTVHAPLALEWIASEFEIDVLILLRHPGSILASWISLDIGEQYVPFAETPAVRHLAEEWGVRLPGPDHLEQMIWQIGMLVVALERAAERHPEWVVRTHEQMCVDPIAQFHRLYDDLGLQWNEQTEEFLVDNNRPGKGFRTRRLATDQLDSWKHRLTPDQIRALQRVMSWLPLTAWSAEDFAVADHS